MKYQLRIFSKGSHAPILQEALYFDAPDDEAAKKQTREQFEQRIDEMARRGPGRPKLHLEHVDLYNDGMRLVAKITRRDLRRP